MSQLLLDDVLTALRDTDAELEAGAHLVGGLIRDRLLGRPAKDVDVVVLEVAPERLLAGVAARLRWPAPAVFERFATAHIAGDGWEVEAVRARSLPYDPGSRRPEKRPGTLAEDIVRRDFTVNALAQRLADGELIDLTGRGLEDLRSGVLRTPLEPVETLGEDPLRILRAGRLVASHGFTPAPGLVEAMEEVAPRLSLVSVERICAELRRLLAGEHALAGLRLVAAAGALTAVLAPASTAPADLAATGACAADVPTRLAALLVGSRPAAAADALRRLRFSTAECDAVSGLLSLEPATLAERAGAMDDTAVRHLSLAAGSLRPRLLDLAAALGGRTDPLGASERIATLGARLRALDPTGALAQRRPPLDGHSVGQLLGVTPGPAVGEALRALLVAIADGAIPADDAQAATRWLADRPQGAPWR